MVTKTELRARNEVKYKSHKNSDILLHRISRKKSDTISQRIK